MPAFAMRPAEGDRGAVYDGPHGPMEYVPDAVEAGATAVLMPGGEARLQWTFGTDDYDALKGSGVPLTVAGLELRLRQDGKQFLLEGPEGVIGVARRRRFGRGLSIEDPAGNEVVSVKGGKGEVKDGATREHVAFALLVRASGITTSPDTGGPPTPF